MSLDSGVYIRVNGELWPAATVYGPQGEQGEQGIPGPVGPQGPPGQDGADGWTVDGYLIETAGEYPARPAEIPAGAATFVGPDQPGTVPGPSMLDGDVWLNTTPPPEITPAYIVDTELDHLAAVRVETEGTELRAAVIEVSSETAAGLNAPSWNTVVDESTPFAWLKFEDTVAGSFLDATGNGRNGTARGAPLLAQPDRLGTLSAVELNGTTDAVHWNAITPVIVSSIGWTLEWVYKPLRSTSGEALLGINTTSGGNQILFFQQNPGYLEFTAGTGARSDPRPLVPGEWHHFALVDYPTAGLQVVFLDGAPYLSSARKVLNSTDTITFGSESDSATSWGDWAKGMLAEAAAYSYPFTQARVARHAWAATGRRIMA